MCMDDRRHPITHDRKDVLLQYNNNNIIQVILHKNSNSTRYTSLSLLSLFLSFSFHISSSGVCTCLMVLNRRVFINFNVKKNVRHSAAQFFFRFVTCQLTTSIPCGGVCIIICKNIIIRYLFITCACTRVYYYTYSLWHLTRNNNNNNVEKNYKSFL